MFGDVGLLDKERLAEILKYLNERLRENQLQLEITVYGGSIMTMVYDVRPATKDIDCVFTETNFKLLENMLNLTKSAFSLSEGWINEEIKEPLKSMLKEDNITFRTYSNLRILKPRAEQLLAMKVLAARPEREKDFIDACLLCRDLKIETKEELFKIITPYVPMSLLGERQMNFIKYLWEDLGYDWE